MATEVWWFLRKMQMLTCTDKRTNETDIDEADENRKFIKEIGCRQPQLFRAVQMPNKL